MTKRKLLNRYDALSRDVESLRDVVRRCEGWLPQAVTVRQHRCGLGGHSLVVTHVDVRARYSWDNPRQTTAFRCRYCGLSYERLGTKDWTPEERAALASLGEERDRTGAPTGLC